MKRVAMLIVAVAIAGVAVYAHEGNEHVRGVVTQISARSITVQVDKAVRTLTLTAKTTYQRAGKPALLGDVKVGDRVVIDVPEKSTDALLIQIGTAPAAAAPKTPPAKTAQK